MIQPTKSEIAFFFVYLDGSAKDSAYFEELINLTTTRKKRPKSIQLRYHTSDRPQVNGAVVSGRVQQHLWRSIPAQILASPFVLFFK